MKPSAILLIFCPDAKCESPPWSTPSTAAASHPKRKLEMKIPVPF
jgi:hypothetical protein